MTEQHGTPRYPGDARTWPHVDDWTRWRDGRAAEPDYQCGDDGLPCGAADCEFCEGAPGLVDRGPLGLGL